MMEGKWNLMDVCTPNIPQNTSVYTHIHTSQQNLWALKSFSKLMRINKKHVPNRASEI